nr:MAG TPA: hypothetical protein [Caudoviricetes sp.]
MIHLSKDRTGSYHTLAVLKRCRIATRLDNLQKKPSRRQPERLK